MHLGLSVWMHDSKNDSSDWLDFFTQKVLCPWFGPPPRRSGSRSALNNLFQDSSPLGEIRHKSMPRRQTCVVIKTCIMTSQVRHSELGSVISDCLVVLDWEYLKYLKTLATLLDPRLCTAVRVWNSTHGVRVWQMYHIDLDSVQFHSSSWLMCGSTLKETVVEWPDMWMWYVSCPTTVKPRYNAVSGRHLLKPRYKRGAL